MTVRSVVSWGVAIVALLCIVCVVVVVRAVVYGPPAVDVTRRGPAVQFESNYLGEYRLGFERIVVHDSLGAVVCDVVGDGGSLSSTFELTPGVNHPSTMFGASAKVIAPTGPAAVFDLRRGEPYVVTLYGNNGFGRTTSRSISITL